MFLASLAFLCASPSLQRVCADVPPGTGYQYGTTHFRESLKIYVPDSHCGTLPLMIYIHGGGWLADDDTDVVPYLPALIDRGFAVASLNYRWSTDAIFPAQIHDCKGAVRWLRAHAAMFNIDVNRFGVFGDSAGAHLASLLGTSAGVASLEGNIGGNLGQSSAVQAVAEFSAPIDMFAFGAVYNQPDSIVSLLFGHWFGDIIAHMSNPSYATLVALVNSSTPTMHVTADDPPFYIVHGSADTTVDPQHAQWLSNALIQAGVPATLHYVAGAGHELPPSEYEAPFNFLAHALNARRPADVNCDGKVNVDDLLALINSWGPCPTPPAPCPADINGDGAVDVQDLLLLINNWT